MLCHVQPQTIWLPCMSDAYADLRMEPGVAVIVVNSVHQNGVVFSNWMRAMPNKALSIPPLLRSELPG